MGLYQSRQADDLTRKLADMSKRKPLDASAFAAVAVPIPDPVAVAVAKRPTAPTPEARQPSRAGKVQVQAWVPAEMRRQLKVLAATTDTTIEELITRGIQLVLADTSTR